MRKVEVSKSLSVFVWDKSEKIDLLHHGIIEEFVPTEVHVKEEGSIDDTPSYSFLFDDLQGGKFLGQISYDMLEKVMFEAYRVNDKIKSVEIDKVAAGGTKKLYPIPTEVYDLILSVSKERDRLQAEVEKYEKLVKLN